MERTLYLCFACAADMAQGYDLEEAAGAAEERKMRKMRPESLGRDIPHKSKK